MNVVQSTSGFFTAYDFQVLTVSTTAVGFDLAKLVPQGSELQRDLGMARLILVTVEGNTIRYTLHGVDPVATVSGHLAYDRDVLSFANFQAMRAFRAVREGGADGKLQVTFLR